MSKKLTIDTIELFSMLGLEFLEPPEKEKILKNINEIVWTKFLLEELHKLLSLEDLEKLNELIQKKTPPIELLAYIEKKHPEVEKALFAYTNVYKADFVREYLQNRYNELCRLRDKGPDQKTLNTLLIHIAHYLDALELAQQGKWQELVLHMKKTP